MTEHRGAPRLRGVALAVVLMLAQGCGGQDIVSACTLIGGFDGVSVAAYDLGDRDLTVRLDVCDDVGCVRAEGPMRRIEGAPGGQQPHRFNVEFDRLARALPPGRVTMRAQVHDADGVLVARRSEAVTLEASFPNGEECDGPRGFVHGSIRLTAADRVTGTGD